MSTINFLHGYTEDDLNLQGIHWCSDSKDVCVILVHGMSGNIIENYFAEVLGDTLSENEYGLIYGHNRGYGHINDIRTSEIQEDGGNKTRRIGQVYERFEESFFDIDLWVKQAKKLNYKKIILMGHSLGCNKVINYIANTDMKVDGIILASPPDMVGLAKLKKYQPNYEEMLHEAKLNIKDGNTKKIISSILWDWYSISSQTFLDLFEDKCVADNIPLLRNPEKFEELSKIDVPIFAFMGEYDDIKIHSLKEDLEQIRTKAINCPDFEINILSEANHVYSNKEQELSNMILSWLQVKFEAN